MFALFLEIRVRSRPQDLWPSFISETGLNFLIWTQCEIGLGNLASTVSRAHVKRPKEVFFIHHRFQLEMWQIWVTLHVGMHEF